MGFIKLFKTNLATQTQVEIVRILVDEEASILDVENLKSTT